MFESPRVISRPAALLDDESEAALLTAPGSDAAKYVAEGNVFGRLGTFLSYARTIVYAEVGHSPGYVETFEVGDHKVLAVPGELTETEEEPVYGFIIPTIWGDFMSVGRYTGEAHENEQLLSWMGIANVRTPVLLSGDFINEVEDPAKVHELTQILAIGLDAVEWAFD